MSKVNEISRENWILNTFPEWGTWINEEIEAEKVEKGKVAMWWLGNMGTWIKTEGDANIVIDLWVSTGKKTKTNPYMKPKHQHQRAVGCVRLQPNLRNTPCILDPFKVKKIDAVLATHSHSDHIDVNVAAAIVQNCPEAKFIGPKSCIDLWAKWGVPEDRMVCVRPGDEIKIKDMTITMVESFDRTMLLTVADDNETLKGKLPPDMDDLAVNYIVKTPGGNIYHAGDSHYSNYYVKHARDHKIDVALVGYGENPRGMTDKLTSSDVLKVAESLDVEVIIPIHYDIWTNFMADPKEIEVLYEMRKNRMKYKFKPYIWQPGGKFIYPDNKNDREYMFPRGFEDAFELEPDLPFLQIL